MGSSGSKHSAKSPPKSSAKRNPPAAAPSKLPSKPSAPLPSYFALELRLSAPASAPPKPPPRRVTSKVKQIFCESCLCLMSQESKIDFGCIHEYCRICVRKDFTRKIAEESVDPLKCLNPACSVPALRSLIHGVLNEKEFADYENLCIKNNGLELDKKPCPKCLQPDTVNEPEHLYGYCEACDYIFCIKCAKDYHYGFGGYCEDLELEIPEELHESPIPDANTLEVIRMLERLSGYVNQCNSGPRGPPVENVQSSSHVDEFECQICFIPNRVRINFGCGHDFCFQCIQAYFEEKISGGVSQGYICPAPECTVEAKHSLIKRVLDSKTFEKYDEMLLNDAIARDMPEIVNCPKLNCQRRVFAEPEFGYCDVCDYRFCTECNQAFHGLIPCGITEAEYRAELQRIETAKSEAARSHLQKQHEARRKDQIAKTREFIKKVCKKCPSCRINIEKTEGCNHMECARCRAHFCWLCLTELDPRHPYNHFNELGLGLGSSCLLFPLPPDHEM